MTAFPIALSCTLGNIIWSCHNRRHEKELLRLQLPLLNSLFTTDDDDDEELEYFRESQAVSA